jgi:hypothetical protein
VHVLCETFLNSNSWYAVPAAALSGVSDSANSEVWHRALAAVAGAAVVETATAVDVEAAVVGTAVVDPMVDEVDVVGAVSGFDFPRHPPATMITTDRAAKLRLTVINPALHDDAREDGD